MSTIAFRIAAVFCLVPMSFVVACSSAGGGEGESGRAQGALHGAHTSDPAGDPLPGDPVPVDPLPGDPLKGDPVPECPQVMAPTADYCPKGVIKAVKTSAGCDSFECLQCPEVMAPEYSACTGGTWVERHTPNGGCVTGFDCVKN